MSIANLVKLLMDAGVQPDVIVAAVAEAEACVSGGIPVESVDPVAERRRAYDRERKRKFHRNSTGTPPEQQNAPLSIGKLEEDLSEERKREAPAKRLPPEKRGTRLPPDWMPDAEDAQYAASLGFPAVAYDREVEKFRNFWHAKPGKDGSKLDWRKTFHNWLIRGAERLTPAKDAYRPTVVQTTPAVFVERGSPQWQAWTRFRGKEPVSTHHGGKEGQFMKSEWPPQETAA